MAGPVRFKRAKRRFGPRRPTTLERAKPAKPSKVVRPEASKVVRPAAKPSASKATTVRPAATAKPAATVKPAATAQPATAAQPSTLIELANELTKAESLRFLGHPLELDDSVIGPGPLIDIGGGLDPDVAFGDLVGGRTLDPWIRIFRPVDMIELMIFTSNVELNWPHGGQGPGTLALANEDADGRLKIYTAPQHIAEDTVFRDEGGLNPYTLPLTRMIANGSRLILRWPKNRPGIEFTSAALLELIASLPLVVRPQSQAQAGPVATGFTALELPYRLYTSPDKGADTRLRGPATPVVGNGWHELHRLRIEHESGAPELPWRALTSPDVRLPDDPSELTTTPAGTGETMVTSLLPRTRSELVHLTDNPSGNDAIDAIRAPFTGRVALTALGADAHFEGTWNAPAGGVDLEGWTHKTRLGRDTFVREVMAGFLYPYGFKASLVRISEREIHGQTPAALLVSRMLIIIRERVVERDAPNTPFVRFEIQMDQTGLLDDTNASNVPGEARTIAMWPRSAGRDIKFPIVAVDRQGRRHRFDTSLIFVKGSSASQSGVRTNLDNAWAADTDRHEQGMQGAIVAYAGANEHDAALPTMLLKMAASNASGGRPFAAALGEAEVKLAAVDALGGAAGTVALHYAPQWTGNHPNPGKVWAEFVDSLTAGPAAEAVGGVAQLSLAMAGLAIDRGPISALGSVADGDYAGAVMDLLGDAKLLGGLSLADLVDKAVQLGTIGRGDGRVLPRLTFDPRHAKAVLHWEPEFGTLDLGFVKYEPRQSSPQGNLVHAEISSDPNDTQLLDTRLANFTLSFAGALAIHFNALGYRNESGRKPEVTVDIENVEFLGALTFVNDLKNLLNFGEGFAIDISGPRLDVRSGFSLPSMPVGMFELADLAIGSELRLPFDGSAPTLRFNISRREAPFLVAVCGVGGGGWLALDLDTEGIRGLEVGLFAAGSMSLDIGVASGGVSIQVGVTFSYDGPSQLAVVTAFIEVAGAVTVLGLICVSVTFYLGLSYSQSASGKAQLTGTASVRVKVSVLFFSTSVTLSVERKLAGSDPPFSAQTSLSDWKTRQLAYA